jgi:circadian clock protein KaiC
MLTSRAPSEPADGGVPGRRSPTGIVGLDVVLHGGLPRGRTTIVVGGAGAGKTILAAQYLIAGAAEFDEPGLFVTFEESSQSVQTNFASLKLPFAELLGKKLHVIDGRLPPDTIDTGSFDLSGLIAMITLLTAKFGLRRIVLDGIDALFSLSENTLNSRREVQRLLNWLANSGLTAILTVKSSDERLVPAGREFMEYAADGVIRLDTRLIGHALFRKLRVIKMRGSAYHTGEHGFVISERGIELPFGGRDRVSAPLSQRRVSSGFAGLDDMLSGGYREGTVTLISGLPGTAKTTLAGAFLAAGCALGKTALLIGLDESPEQIMLDLTSVGLELQGYHKRGLLPTLALSTEALNVDEQFLKIEHLLEEYNPSLLVVDPISAYHLPGATELIDEMTDRLTRMIKERGLTAVFTAVADSRVGELESTSIRVSTIADTWIHLSYAVQRGERNRTLTIVKSRGIAHSNQMRELVLSSEGATLRSVRFSQGAMLLGTARLEQEQEDLATALAREGEVEAAVAALDHRVNDLAARKEEAERELSELAKEKARMIERADKAEQAFSSDRAALLLNMQRNPDPQGAAEGTDESA